MSLLSRRMMMKAEEKENMKKWKIFGDEYELAEDTTDWSFEIPDSTEVIVQLLPMGTTANENGGSLSMKLCDGEDNYTMGNLFVNCAGNSKSKIWNRTQVEVELDEGMMSLVAGIDGGYWDFSVPMLTHSASLKRRAAYPVSLEKITKFSIFSTLYIGAGSKVKIWAR